MIQPSKPVLKDQLTLAAEEIIRLKVANERMAEELVQAAEMLELQRDQVPWGDEPDNEQYHTRMAMASLLVGMMIGILIGWLSR